MDTSLHYCDYYWKDGIPYGKKKLKAFVEPSFKIVMDPYRKRISIEKYERGKFSHIIYDSALLDFRHLKPPAEHLAWQKITLEETSQKIICHIRNQDDRLLFEERYTFEQHLCRECRVVSPHGIPLSSHRMFYTYLGDSWNGTILYDPSNHPVMLKRYEASENGEFGILLEEDWNLNNELNI